MQNENLKSIVAYSTWDGVKTRSIMEMYVKIFLEKMGGAPQYEPKLFRLEKSNQKYLPDFLVKCKTLNGESIDVWVEVKGKFNIGYTNDEQKCFEFIEQVTGENEKSFFYIIDSLNTLEELGNFNNKTPSLANGATYLKSFTAYTRNRESAACFAKYKGEIYFVVFDNEARQQPFFEEMKKETQEAIAETFLVSYERIERDRYAPPFANLIFQQNNWHRDDEAIVDYALFGEKKIVSGVTKKRVFDRVAYLLNKIGNDLDVAYEKKVARQKQSFIFLKGLHEKIAQNELEDFAKFEKKPLDELNNIQDVYGWIFTYGCKVEVLIKSIEELEYKQSLLEEQIERYKEREQQFGKIIAIANLSPEKKRLLEELSFVKNRKEWIKDNLTFLDLLIDTAFEKGLEIEKLPNAYKRLKLEGNSESNSVQTTDSW